MTLPNLESQADHFASLPAKLWPGGTDPDHEDAIQIYAVSIEKDPQQNHPSAVLLLLAGNGPTVRAQVSKDHGTVTATAGFDPSLTTIRSMDPTTASQIFKHYTST